MKGPRSFKKSHRTAGRGTKLSRCVSRRSLRDRLRRGPSMIRIVQICVEHRMKMPPWFVTSIPPYALALAQNADFSTAASLCPQLHQAMKMMQADVEENRAEIVEDVWHVAHLSKSLLVVDRRYVLVETSERRRRTRSSIQSSRSGRQLQLLPATRSLRRRHWGAFKTGTGLSVLTK